MNLQSSREFECDLGPDMQIGLIKPLLVREKGIAILHTLVKKLFSRSSMQYGFPISKCCCHPPDNVDLLYAVDCLLHV